MNRKRNWSSSYTPSQFNQPASGLGFGSMFGPLLRRSILQGSASRTWNYFANFTQLLWCKLKYLRDLRMPRTRRKHYSSHSRSRSRSYEAKRRRLDDGAREGSYRKRSRSRDRDRSDLEYSEYRKGETTDLFGSDDEVATTSGKSSKLSRTTKRKAPKAPKKERAAVSASKTGWELDSDTEDEAATRKRAAPALLSVLSRRVPDGVLRHTTNLTGDVYVDIKVYNTRDILRVEPKDRWERAVVSLKYQGDADSPELEPLKEVIKRCKKKFIKEGTIFAEKKN